MKVLKVEPHTKNAEWRVVTLDDQRQFIVFSAKLADALEPGKPLPQGTEEQAPKFDGALPSLKLPRPQGGGQTAWRNTKEGFEAETRGRQRWQEIEEEKRDRRTALMQAVAYMGLGVTTGHGPPEEYGGLVSTADEFYAWLRSSPVPGGQEASNAAQGPAQAVSGPSGTSPHLESYPTVTPARDISSPSSGEAAAASVEPGEGRSTLPRTSAEKATPSPGSYPMKPEDCNHRFGTGKWLTTVQIDGMARCPRCGMSAAIYRESDVGP